MSTDSGSSNTGTEDVGSYRSVDINPSFTHLSQKDMTGNSPGSSPIVNRRNDLLNRSSIKDQAIQQQILQKFDGEIKFNVSILQLKKQQQMQQQILLQHFQAQQQQLAEQHEQQLKQHLKELWEKQREVEEREQRERHEQERIESLKKKEKHEQSAVASSEVKQKLQGFLLNKKQREAAAASNSTQGQFRNWNILQSEPNVSGTPFYLNSLLGKFDEDFPLRKTASEPNLLRLRLKKRFYEKRCSPIVRKKDRLINKKKSYIVEASNSNSDSGPNSPPVVVSNSQISSSGGQNTPIQEEIEPHYRQLSNNVDHNESVNDLSLFSSPSLPNISLGRPASSTENSKRLVPVSEAEMRAAFTARLGMPLTGQFLPSTLPCYPSLPGIETVPEYSNPTSPVYIHKQMQALEQSRQSYFPSIYEAPSAITDSQVAHARLNKQGHRPLGRTKSSPLPLGHLMISSSSSNSLGVHYEDCSEQQAQQQQQQQQKNYLKQQIRQTLLTRRVENRSHSHSTTSHNNNTEEEDEEESLTSEIIDLTGGRGSSNKNNDNSGDQLPNQKQIREGMFKNLLQVNDVNSPGTSHPARPLARAFSSPLVALNTETGAPSVPTSPNLNHYIPSMKMSGPHRVTTALAFDSLMLKHACICGNNSSHPEHGGRLQSVWARLVETGLVQRCDRVRSRKASLEELQTCHTEAHTLLFGTNPLNRQKIDANKLSELSLKSFVRLPCGGIGVDSDTTWNELHTAPAARMAVGCVTDLAFKAASGDIRNGFAVVRPPGHHAEAAQAMGFCFFNSVAVAAKLLQQKLDFRRILIIDWDVHHGNGTQQMFYEDRRVLYLSIHRHDDGNFFPGTGSPIECGSDSGLGYNVNVAWIGGLNPPMADAEYLAAFRTIVMPIARDYVPDIILVSAGFDAAFGHPPPLGGYKVSPACFGFMTQQLTQLADGKVILSLEGGYDLPAICDCSEECVRALLDGNSSPVSEEELRRKPCQNAIDTLQKTIAIQLQHWPVLKKLAHTVGLSAVDAQSWEENEAITAMASLSMNKRNSTSLKSIVPEISVEPMDEDEVK